MNREISILITVIFFILVILMLKFGARLNTFSSIALSAVLSFIILNFIYPPSQNVNQAADISLLVYAFLEILFILIIVFYILYKSINDKQKC